MSTTRRNFLTSFAGTMIGFTAGYSFTSRNGPVRAVMPPGAISLKRLKWSCTACGLCMSSCPSKVIVAADFGDYGDNFLGPFELLPKLDFSKGSCDPGCSRCAEVCPAKALRLFFPKEARARVKIGVAEWSRENCRTSKGETCTLCSERCPTGAIALVADAEGAAAHPKVNVSKCVGCGRCENYCPAERKAIRVAPLDPQGFAFGDETLVAYLADGTEWTSRARGVKPLLDAIDHDLAKFAGARCCDRIVGRAAAFLYAKLGVAEVFAPVMATGAAKLLARHGIRARFAEEVPGIRNRANDGPCPMDSAVRDFADGGVDGAIAALRERLGALSGKAASPR